MPFIHDIIIVGAGTCGLGLAARLCEQTPAAHYTDEEHRRYWWIRKNKHVKLGALEKLPGGKKKARDLEKTSGIAEPLVGQSQADGEPSIGQRLGEYHTLVIDATDKKFMTRWDTNFETFGINHLRSPMFFHVDPADRDGLLAYAQENHRYDTECEEIKGVVGQEISKHARKQRSSRQHKHQAIGKDTNVDERDRRDYFVPSTPLFHDHCRSLVHKYQIDEKRLIVKDVVADIQYGLAEDMLGESSKALTADLDKIFKVRTWRGVHYARSVVLAIGPSMPLNSSVLWPESSCHTSQITDFPSLDVQAKIRAKQKTHVLVVGGGLTSAQIALRAIGKGVSKVWLIMRGPIKIKHFDMTLEWVGKFKNQEKASFWSADTDDERLEMIKTARNGGSIPLKYKKLLDQQVAKGRLVIQTHTTLRSICKSSDASGMQMILTEPAIKDLPPIDYVYFATGPRSALNQLQMPSCCNQENPSLHDDASLPVPFLENLQKEYPIHWLNGLPVLNHDCGWSSVEEEKRNIPLFVTGSLAALRLGPGAANLEGARTGAERVAWGIQATIGTELTRKEQIAQGLNAYIEGEGGMFDSLPEVDDY